jgi:hypothetical protein
MTRVQSLQVSTYSSPELLAALTAAQSPALACDTRPPNGGAAHCTCLSANHVWLCASLVPRQLALVDGNGSLNLTSLPSLESLDIRGWSSLPTLDLTGLTNLAHLSIELGASPLKESAFNTRQLGEIVGLADVCRSGKLRSLRLKFVGLRELDLSGCAHLEAMDLLGLVLLERFALHGATSLRAAEVGYVFAAEDSVRRQLLPHPGLFYLQYTENEQLPTAAVTDGWRGFVCRVHPDAPMFTSAGGLCNLGRVCHFNAGNCAPSCAVTAESRCALGRFCPPPKLAASRCAKGVDFDVAFELFNPKTPTSDDYACIRFVQTIHAKTKPADGAACAISVIDTNVKNIGAALNAASFTSCVFRFSDDQARLLSFVLTDGARQVRLGTAGFECGALFAVGGAMPYAANTTTFAGRVVGAGQSASALANERTLVPDAPNSQHASEETLNYAAIALAVVLVAVLSAWLVSCALLMLRLRRARRAMAEASEARAREMQSVSFERRQRRRRSSRRGM